METYVSFYTSKPFWTGEKPDVDLLSKTPKIFEETFSERTLEYKDENIYIAFCKDGLIMTQIGKVESKREYFKNLNREKEPLPPEIQYTSEYLDYLNAIQILLASSILKVSNFDHFTCETIFNGIAFRVTLDNGKFSGSGIPQGSGSKYIMGRYYSQYLPQYPISFDSRIVERKEISKAVFDMFWKDFQIAYANEEIIRILSLVNSAYSDFKNLNFRQSLIQSWFIIEFIINKKWDNFLSSKQKSYADGKERINAERKKNLVGRDYTASIMTNILELTDLIDFELLQKVDNIRKKRNNVVHSLDLLSESNRSTSSNKEKKIKIIDCLDALTVIIELVKVEYIPNSLKKKL